MKDLANDAILKGPSTVFRYVGPIDNYCVLGKSTDTACKSEGDF
jgi:hypothetical protein